MKKVSSASLLAGCVPKASSSEHLHLDVVQLPQSPEKPPAVWVGSPARAVSAQVAVPTEPVATRHVERQAAQVTPFDRVFGVELKGLVGQRPAHAITEEAHHCWIFIAQELLNSRYKEIEVEIKIPKVSEAVMVDLTECFKMFLNWECLSMKVSPRDSELIVCRFNRLRINGVIVDTSKSEVADKLPHTIAQEAYGYCLAIEKELLNWSFKEIEVLVRTQRVSELAMSELVACLQSFPDWDYVATATDPNNNERLIHQFNRRYIKGAHNIVRKSFSHIAAQTSYVILNQDGLTEAGNYFSDGKQKVRVEETKFTRDGLFPKPKLIKT